MTASEAQRDSFMTILDLRAIVARDPDAVLPTRAARVLALHEEILRLDALVVEMRSEAGKKAQVIDGARL